MALVATLSVTDHTALWHLAVVSFVAGIGMAFYYPAYTAWLPALVPESDLMAVNGFEGMVRPTVGQAHRPGRGRRRGRRGLVRCRPRRGRGRLAARPARADRPCRSRRCAATSTAEGEPKAPVASALADVREGFGYMVRTPWLLATLLFASLMILVMMGPFEVLLPFLIKDRLGGGPGDHAWVLAAFGIGGAVGSMAMASIKMPRRYLTVMNLMWGVGCLPFLVIGFATAVWQVVVSAFVLGALFSAPMVIWGTLLQRRVPPHMLGRVASLDFFVSVSLMPVSMALAGPVSEAIGLRATFAIAGIAPGVFAIVAILWARLPQDELAHPLRDDEDERDPSRSRSSV